MNEPFRGPIINVHAKNRRTNVKVHRLLILILIIQKNSVSLMNLSMENKFRPFYYGLNKIGPKKIFGYWL